jgi:hypothetical protein
MNSLAESGGFLEAALQRGEFISTAELVLGRDHNVVDAETFVREAAATTDGIKIISVTDLPGGNPALPPEAFASFILEHHLVPIAHLSFRSSEGGEQSVQFKARGMSNMEC